MRTHTSYFRIGVVDVALSTPVRSLLARYESLYREARTDESPQRCIRVRVEPKRAAPWKRRRYEVIVNDRIRFEPCRSEEVLPYVEWAVNWEVPRVLPEYLQLHASSMEVGGVGVVFPGTSGSGKSTLTAGLLAHGWRYLCDEFALIHADTLALHPYPRAICIKRPSYPVIETLGLRLHENRQYVKGGKGRVGFVRPTDVRPDAVGRACPIGCVIFPKYVERAQPQLLPISRGQAAFDLHAVCFNLLDCERLGLDVIAEMIRGASCYRLVSGEINATCGLVQSVVERAGVRAPRCA